MQRGATGFVSSPQWMTGQVSTELLVEFHDQFGTTVKSVTATTGVDGSLTVDFLSTEDMAKFDGEYAVYAYTMDVDGNAEDTVLVDTLYVYRPYVDPYSLGTTDEEVATMTNRELAARLLIDSVVQGGFYYTMEREDATGFGTDILSLGKRFCKVNYVYENNVLIFNRITPLNYQETFFITNDHHGLAIAGNGEYNRRESKRVGLNLAQSDAHSSFTTDLDNPISITNYGSNGFFSPGYDYAVYGEAGYVVVPQDIREATLMLMDDFACGRLNYTTQYVSEYSTDQFKVKYNPKSTNTTGNFVVDSIIKGYANTIGNIGVL